MTIKTRNIESSVENRSIPQWVKIAVTFLTFSIVAIFVLLTLNGQRTFFGLPAQAFTAFSLMPALLAVGLLAAFWFFPDHAFTRSIYWLMRFFRAQLCVFALLGVVILIVVRAPILSIRGGIPLLNLLLLFGMGWFLQPARTDHFPSMWLQRLFSQVEKMASRINSLPPLPLRILVSILPGLIVCSVIYLAWNATLSDYGPYSLWNDETGYWVWVRSFAHVGFDVGYNAPNELLARASFNHYGEGSPIYVYLYGGIAQLVGWSQQLPLLINFVILALAIFLFTQSTRLEPVQIVFTSLITIVIWPILLFLPMTTHETLNQAIGFVLAVIFFRLLTQRESISHPVRFAYIVLVYLAALTRLSWGLFLVPVIFYSLDGKLFRRLLLSGLAGLGLYVSALMITNYLVPPTNNSILVNLRDSVGQGPQILINYAVLQLAQMFKFRQLNPNIAVLLQILIILGWNGVRVIRSVRSGTPINSIVESQSVFHIYNVTTLVTAGLLFYIQEGFYRTFTPSLLIIYLLLTLRKDYKFLATLLTINLFFFYSYLNFYAGVGDLALIQQDFTTEIPERAQLQPSLEHWIRFEPDAQTPWCNTLLIPLHYYDARLTLIPPGIGISYVLDLETLKTPLKSKYLLLDTETYQALEDRLNTQLLDSYYIGDLYYNLDSGCELKK